MMEVTSIKAGYNMKKIMVIFLVIVGGYLLFTFFGSILSFFGEDNDSIKLTNKIDTIEFDINSATVTVIPENRDDVKIKLDGRGKAILEKKGDTIIISHENNSFISFPFFRTAHLKVYVPNDYNKDMVMDLGSGTINLGGESEKNPFQLKELSIEMNSGNLKLNNLDIEDFILNLGSGNLSAHSLVSEISSLDISSGNVKLTDFIGELEADVSSGKLDIQVRELQNSMKIDISSGDLVLDLPDQADFTLDGKTGSGNLSFDLPLEVEKQDNRHLKGTRGTGKHEIEIDVSSGNARIH